MSRNTTFSVGIRDGDKLEQRLRRLRTGSETALNRTVSDFRSRAPGWISKGIKQHYGVDQAGVKSATVRIVDTGSSGSKLAGVKVNYRGRTLTLTHFNMSPKQAPATRQSTYARIPGQKLSAGSPVAMIRPLKKYKIKATIIKGQRIEMSERTFVANGLPWIRNSESGKIKVVHTLSVPQMIRGRAKNTIDSVILENVEKRFRHNVEQIMK